MIRIENLRKSFQQRASGKRFELVIEQLLIPDGQIIYLLGPNGSGKTTVLALIQGLVQAESGSVIISGDNESDDVNLFALAPYQRARMLGVVPQDPDEALVNEMSVVDHVLVALARNRQAPWFLPRVRCQHRAAELVKHFGLGFEDRLHEAAGNLSGGERQVLTFCLSTIGAPQILLLDEFTAALDPEMARKVLTTVISSIRTQQLTAMIVTHQHREAVENADRIVVLHHGKPCLDILRSTPQFSEERLRDQFRQLYE
jgi:putative ABC transport system ATP-binding protein